MILNRKNIFLFDGIGAMLSLVLTGFILPFLSDEIGVSKQLLYALAVFPFLYAVFSLSCYRFIKEIKSWMLITIIIANLFYSMVSIALMTLVESMTFYGKILFTAEIIVVLGVVALEVKVLKANFPLIFRK